jgi:nucleoside-diphosphate-sugar epimerase
VVIRPPMLYGKSGSFVAYFHLDAAYEAAKKGKVFEALVTEDTRWQTIHQDDVGEAYRLVAEVVSAPAGSSRTPRA